MINSKLPKVGTTIFTVMSKLAAKHNAINLSQGFPDFDCDPVLIDLVYDYMKRGYNQYAPMPGVLELRQALAHKCKILYDQAIAPDSEVTITAGATQAIFTAIATVVNQGDEVILIEPAYDCYGPAVELCGGVVRSYELQAPNYRVDWQALGSLINEKTKLLIINNPHNPTGQIFSKEDMIALENLLEGTDIILLSDEVYEHLIYDGNKHESVLKYPALWKRSFVTFSFGKTFHATGWKMGYCLAPEALMNEFRKVHQFNVFCVNAPVQYALAEYLADEANYNYLSKFYEAKRDFFAARMAGTALKPIPCAGTYFQLYDYSTVSDASDIEFAKWLTREVGVGAIPVSVFYQSQRDEQVVRLCFAKKEETLEAAARRIHTNT